MYRLICLLLVLLCASSLAAEGESRYHLDRRIPVAGDGWWDYAAISTKTDELFVSHGTHVSVIDLRSDAVVGDLPDTPGVHGIAIAPELNRIFVSCGETNVVKVFDLRTRTLIATVPTGGNPDAILFDDASGRVFAFNGRSHDATVIDAATDEVIGSIALGGKPEFARADGEGRVFVNLEDSAEVAELDSRTLEVLQRWSVAPGEAPTGMALDADDHLLFSVCDNNLMTVLDTRDGHLVATVPIGSHPDGAGYDPVSALVFSSNGDGTLTVVRQTGAERFEVVQTVATQPGARTMVIDPVTHAIYLPTAKLIPPTTPGGRYGIVPDSFGVLVVSG